MQLTKTEIQVLRDIKADKIYDLNCPFDCPVDKLEAAGLIELVKGAYKLTEEGERWV